MPEDRKHQAIFAALGILPNFSIASLGRYSATASASWPSGASATRSPSFSKMLSIRMASAEQAIEGLSGGNQQKVVLARWLARDPKVLIVDEPTRGVDVGAKAEVHQILVQLAARGIAVMMISSELPEVLAVSRQDRHHAARAASPARCRPSRRHEERLMELMALDSASRREQERRR